MKFFDWLLNIFSFKSKPVESKPVESKPVESKPVESKPVESKPVQDPIIYKKSKIAIIVGHTKNSPGAVNYKGESEFVFNKRLAEKIKKYMISKYPKKEIKIFFRPEGYYAPAVRQVAKEVGEWKADISMELHFNSFKSVAYGCEILILANSSFSEKTAKIADNITDALSKKFKLKQRNKYTFKNGSVGDGVKPLNPKDRGSLNLKYVEEFGVKYVMLIEPCFANIETSESKAIFENEDEYAYLLADELAKIDV